MVSTTQQPRSLTHPHRVLIALVTMSTLPLSAVVAAPPDISSVPPDLTLPKLSTGSAGPGKRVKEVLTGYETTHLYHVTWLPTDWKRDRQHPVIVELAGNGPYRNGFGDVSTGYPEGSKLGYGISGGKQFIWICLPFVDDTGTRIATRWWGKQPGYDPQPTIRYIKQAVPELCRRHGGDPDRIILAGFSRGAIACNYIGLYDKEIARLWTAMIPYSHYDGVFEKWGYPGADRQSALARLKRLGHRPQFICQEDSGNRARNLNATRHYLGETNIDGKFTFQSTGFRNHNDSWSLRPSAARGALRDWLRRVVRAPGPGSNHDRTSGEKSGLCSNASSPRSTEARTGRVIR